MNLRQAQKKKKRKKTDSVSGEAGYEKVMSR